MKDNRKNELSEEMLEQVSAAGEGDLLPNDSIENETMLIIPVTDGQKKNINQIVIAENPPDLGERTCDTWDCLKGR